MSSALETLPAYESMSFARWLAKATEEYFKDPDVQRRFEAWKKEREQEKQAQECSAD